MADDTMTPERLAELESMDSEWGDLYRETDQAIADLCTALRAAWKDSERLDWADDRVTVQERYDHTHYQQFILRWDAGGIRDAIDDACAKESDGA